MGSVHANQHHLKHLAIPKQGVFGIHGGGNIGLGCMADIVSRSPFEYRMIATSSDKFTNALINSHHRYWIQHGPQENYETTLINNITMVDAKNLQNIIDLYCQVDILAICLTEKAISDVAVYICKGLIARYQNNGGDLQILVLMNKINGAQFVKKIISKTMLNLIQDEHFCNKVLNAIQFIPTVVDRIVNKIDKKTVLMQLRKQLRLIDKNLTTRLQDVSKLRKPIASDVETILSNPEAIGKVIKKYNLQFNLYTAERDFSLCVQDNFRNALHFPNINVMSNLTQFAEVKNKYINGPHSMLAWIGGLMGCKTISEAIGNPSMLWFIKNVMEREIEPILKAEYPNISNDTLTLLKTAFIKRCRASSEDPVVRVGRDPLRKLYRGGRVRGIIELKNKHNLKIATPELERGIAAGILYAVNKVDPENEECRKIQEIYRKNRSYKAVLCYKGPYGDGVYPGLDQHQDHKLISNVLHRISAFEKICKIKSM